MKKILFAGCIVAVFAAFGAGVKISEKFGFDKEDSTKFIQAALDSDEQEIILDKRDTPWIAQKLVCTKGKTIRIGTARGSSPSAENSTAISTPC